MYSGFRGSSPRAWRKTLTTSLVELSVTAAPSQTSSTRACLDTNFASVLEEIAEHLQRPRRKNNL